MEIKVIKYDAKKYCVEMFLDDYSQQLVASNSSTAIINKNAIESFIREHDTEMFISFLKWAKQADLDYPDDMLKTDFEQFNNNLKT